MDEKLKFAHEQSAIMDSFIENSLQTLEATRQDVIKVQEYASNYGYKPSEETIFKELTREDLERIIVENTTSSEENKNSADGDPDLSYTHGCPENSKDSDETTVNASEHLDTAKHTNHTKDNIITEVQPGTPKLLEIGLSKTTLKQLGYTFKEDKEPQSKKIAPNNSNILINEEPRKIISPEDSPISILKNTKTNNSQVQNISYAREYDTNYDTSITSDISILHAPAPNLSNTTIEMSHIEISPGLVVKRPSSKTKPKCSKESDEDLNKEFIGNRYQDAINSTVLVHPSTPLNKVINKNSCAPNVDCNDSPVMPTLQTMDIQKLLKDLKEKPADSNDSDKSYNKNPVTPLPDKTNECELPNIESNSTQVSNKPESLTPELPALKTIDLNKYLSSYKSSHGSVSKSKESIKSYERDNTPEITMNASNLENRTPDFPELTSLSPRY